MNIKRIRVLRNVLLGGGLTVALLFWLNLKTIAVLGFRDEEFELEIENHVELDFFADPQKRVYYSDFNGDTKNERLLLEHGVVSVYINEEKIFKTEQEWDVEDVIIGDFNNDGNPDLGLYLWKTGSFGTSKPFWIKENDDSYKQHLFLYDWDEKQQKIAPLWHSSNLPYINAKTILEDIDRDGKNELIVLEKPYDCLPGQYSKNVAVWRWDEWGFKNIWRSEDGKFDDLEVSK